MRYRFFICKPREPWEGCVAAVSRELRTYLACGETRVEHPDCFAPFDIGRLRNLLCVASGERAGFEPRFKHRQVSSRPLVAITTEYHKAHEVATALSTSLPDDGLMLFDGEMECRANIKQVERSDFVRARLAYQRYRLALFDEFNAASAWRYNFGAMVQKLGECHFYRNARKTYARCSTIDTAISFSRGKSLSNSVLRLYEFLQRLSKNHGESVYCKDGCFIVENATQDYQLRFVVEGYGKSPEWTGWVEGDCVKIERLHRMGVYRMKKELTRMGGGEEEYVRSRLYFPEQFPSRGDWRNPVDRFAGSYKISKQLKKHNLDIVYGSHPFKRHCEFTFHVCDEHGLGWDEWKTSSFFTISEEQAAPLLAIFESVIPYYYEYYYDKFHFRKEEAAQILERIKTVRRQIISDPCDSSLGKILERMLDSGFAWERPDGTKAKRFDESEKREILSSNRLRILALLDFFSWWLSGQRDDPDTYFSGFYVEGP